MESDAKEVQPTFNTKPPIEDLKERRDSAASSDGNSSGTDVEANQLNISLESEHLNPEEIKAHEADTLPMGNGPGDVAARAKGEGKSKEKGENAQCEKFAQRKRKLFDKFHGFAAPFLAEENPLPQSPTTKDKLLQSVRCPPHGIVARYAALALLPLLLWGVAHSVFGPIGAAPNGTLFLLIAMVVCALLLGCVFEAARLPALLGMLITGIVLKNLPGLEFEDSWPDYSSTLRGTALVIILMRAGLGLDPEALKKHSGLVFRLAFAPCLVETLVVAVASHLLLDFPWLWGFMLGFVLAAVSPAVVVPCLLQLQERGYGVDKGIPTLVIAAASVDDVLAISGFTILLGITFKPDADLVSIIFQGPLEALVGLLFGTAYGALVAFLPARPPQSNGVDPKDDSALDGSYDLLRVVFLFSGGLIALFGSQRVDLPGAGALAVLVMAFVAGFGWRKLGCWADEDGDNAVSRHLKGMWFVFQPILFGLIGTEIQISKLDPATVGYGLLVLVVALSVRVVVTFFVVLGGGLTTKERLFVALAWLPKATVQAAIGGVAFDAATKMDPENENRELFLQLGVMVLTIAVLVILITAPIGAVAIMLSAPKLLKKTSEEFHSARDDTHAAQGQDEV